MLLFPSQVENAVQTLLDRFGTGKLRLSRNQNSLIPSVQVLLLIIYTCSLNLCCDAGILAPTPDALEDTSASQ